MKNAFPTTMIVLMACGGASTATSPESTTPPPSAETSPQTGDAPAPSGNECEELATTCHGHDEGNALVAECHILGHDADPAACTARYDECMTACRQAAEAHAHSE